MGTVKVKHSLPLGRLPHLFDYILHSTVRIPWRRAVRLTSLGAHSQNRFERFFRGFHRMRKIPKDIRMSFGISTNGSTIRTKASQSYRSRFVAGRLLV